MPACAEFVVAQVVDQDDEKIGFLHFFIDGMKSRVGTGSLTIG
jgi:hypothetical protein